MVPKPSVIRRLTSRLKYEIRKSVTHAIDKIAGINTEYCKNPTSQQVSSEIVRQAKRYQPSSYLLTYRALRWGRQSFPSHRFLDLGSGAGRVLAIAAWLGLKDINGIEFDEQLCEQAHKNLERFGKRYRIHHSVKVIRQSVTDYFLDDSPWLIYLYNPFGAEIFERFLHNNHTVLSNNDCVFIYINPIHESALTSIGYRLIRSWEHLDFSQSTRVYRHEKFE